MLWNPGFEIEEQAVATLHGWHRSFCMSSIHHRGTEQDPGLVLALDAAENAACHGLALRVKEGTEQSAMVELRARELVSSAYLERELQVMLADGRQVTAVTYVIDRDHNQYCNHPLEKQATIISRAVGGRGPNTEYLYNTASHLTELGIEDPELDWLSARVRELMV
ncbi:gamma-glutamylcyclotransferase [Cognatishimia sp. WU-CL00825]